MKKRLLALFCAVTLIVGMWGAVPVKAEQSKGGWDENLTMITFSKFGVPDGTYGVDTKTGLGLFGTYKGTLDGTIFSGNVYFSDNPEIHFQYGAPGPTQDQGWSGIRIRNAGDGTLILHNAFTGVDIEVLDKVTAGVERLTEGFFNLKISIQYIDMANDNDDAKDDVKLGLWFNDKLYDNKYFEIEDLALKLGSSISCYVEDEGSCFKAESVALNEKKETLDATFKSITLKNFNIADGKYQFTEVGALKNGFEANGGYAFSLDKTVFSANIEFSSKRGTELLYGGGASPWHGLRFDVLGNQLRLCDATYNEEEGDRIYYFDSLLAKVKLLDNKFNLKLSTEFVDYDGDGAKDDVKFGVWFNDVLYNNEYIYFNNYALEMGGNLTIVSYEETKDSYIYIETDKKVITGVDFSIYGFTKNWDKELGEEL